MSVTGPLWNAVLDTPAICQTLSGSFGTGIHIEGSAAKLDHTATDVYPKINHEPACAVSQ